MDREKLLKQAEFWLSLICSETGVNPTTTTADFTFRTKDGKEVSDRISLADWFGEVGEEFGRANPFSQLLADSDG